MTERRLAKSAAESGKAGECSIDLPKRGRMPTSVGDGCSSCTWHALQENILLVRCVVAFQADTRRLDAFHHRCLRKLLRIPCSYISRVPNSEVLQQSGQMLLSALLEQRQIQLYRRITALPADSYVKKVVCKPTGEPIVWNLLRGRGRPRQMWCQCVHKLSMSRA